MIPDSHMFFVSDNAEVRAAELVKLSLQSSSEGIPVFVTARHQDLSGMALKPLFSGSATPTYPVTFWDFYAEDGLPLRTTVSELGPLLLSGLMDLGEQTSQLLQVYFQIADEHDLLLIDTKDLKALIHHVTEHLDDFAEYGTISKSTSSALLRQIAALEAQGGQDFLFEPAIDVRDFVTIDENGFGRIHVLNDWKHPDNEHLYVAFMLYIMAELAENMPLSREKTAVLMIDDTKLLFTRDDPELTDRCVKVLEALSERGIALVFAVENASDLPEKVREQLDEIAETSVISLPEGSLTEEELKAQVKADVLYEKYKIPFERDSAYEFLLRRGIETPESDEESSETASADADSETDDADQKGKSKKDTAAMARRAKSSAKSLGNTVAGTVGRKLGKTIGSNFGSFGETLGANIGASLGRGIMNTFFNED